LLLIEGITKVVLNDPLFYKNHVLLAYYDSFFANNHMHFFFACEILPNHTWCRQVLLDTIYQMQFAVLRTQTDKTYSEFT